jgi:AraC-like DNA-binding protein
VSAEPRYDRYVFGEAVIGWQYSYENVEPRGVADGMATGVELAVQLRGWWRHCGRLSGDRLYGPGDICTISPAETFATSFAASPEAPGHQVGFVFYPEEHEATRETDATLVIPGDERIEDRELVDLAHAVHEGAERGSPVGAEVVRSVVIACVMRHGVLVALDPLLRAKRALERAFEAPLYMRHLAEIVGVRPETFGRRFSARFGMTPVAYRTMLRLNEAARLTWSRRDLSLGEVGAAAGFDDPSYFQRAFRRYFGVTPGAYAKTARGAGAAPPMS